jgi:hypothetical protein
VPADEPVAGKREKQIRFRLSAAEDDHLRTAARDAGYQEKEFSAFLRAVMLSKHVVVVNGTGVVLIPAATSSDEEAVAAQELLQRVLAALEASGQGAVSVPTGAPLHPTPDAAPGPSGAEPEGPASTAEGGGAAGGADTAAAPDVAPSAAAPVDESKSSPGGGDGSVGTGESHEPPAAAEVAGSIPGPGETEAAATVIACQRCGTPLVPNVPHTDEECAAIQARAAGEELAAEVELGEITPPPAALGPGIQPGETYETFMERRREELRSQGRPMIVAGYEADAEYRAALAAPPPPQQPVSPPVTSQQVAAGAATACGICGALKQSTGPCPDCGAPA